MATAPVTTELPTLRMSEADDPATAASFQAQLREVTHEMGFFYLADHGIDPALTRRIISVSREFFALPEAQKLSIEMVGSPHFRGYNRVGGELTGGTIDWREQLDIAPEREPLPSGPSDPDYNILQGPNLWPDAMPQLRDVVQEWNATLAALAERLLVQWAQSLGQPATAFDGAFADRPATLTKIIRYPGRVGEAPAQGVGWHNDPGVLTLLLVEPGTEGLQIEHEGDVLDVPPIDGALIVNIGEMLEWATDGYLKATKHRVLAPRAGTDRVSVPYFHNPALEAQFPKIELSADLAAKAAGITLDETNPILDVFGKNLLKARVRAHPDVVAAHHPHLQ